MRKIVIMNSPVLNKQNVFNSKALVVRNSMQDNGIHSSREIMAYKI